ncbi:MAG TPA: hypothetical protein VGO00_13250 [Kofleriaceae bacterium]|nr:hypothetical protein [Kofleriaceae bacterium]
MLALARAIEERFDAVRTSVRGDTVVTEVKHGDVWYRGRLVSEPFARVAVSLPSTDGFELALRWNDRWTGEELVARAASFDDSFLVETNDLVLAANWLDHEARSALLASRYISARTDRATALMLRDSGWEHQVSNDEVSARRRSSESSAERMGDMLSVCLVIASRPMRWARAFAAVARALGGEAAPRIELGGRPVIRVRRGRVEVGVRLMRRLGPGDRGRLRTVVGSHRDSTDGGTLSLISDGLPRAAWPSTAYGPISLPIDARAASLLEIACPSATVVRPHDVVITFDGAIADRDRLGAAIELAAHWSSDPRHTGPYR